MEAAAERAIHKVVQPKMNYLILLQISALIFLSDECPLFSSLINKNMLFVSFVFQFSM